MKKSILNIGKALNKAEQKSINGGEAPGEGNNEGPNSRGCYEQPVADVDCISPWVYFPGCGFQCKIRPTF